MQIYILAFLIISKKNVKYKIFGAKSARVFFLLSLFTGSERYCLKNCAQLCYDKLDTCYADTMFCCSITSLRFFKQ